MWLMICIGNAQIEYSSSLNIEFIIYKRYFFKKRYVVDYGKSTTNIYSCTCIFPFNK